MAATNTQRIVLGSIAVATTSSVVYNLRKSGARTPAPKVVIGGFVLAVGLLFASEFQPEFIQSVSVLILVASIIGPHGTELFDLATNLATGKTIPVNPSANGAVTDRTNIHS